MTLVVIEINNKIDRLFQMLVGAGSLKENIDLNDTSVDISTSSVMDGGDTMDISMTESISFDTCSVTDDVRSLNSAPSSKEVSPDHKSLTLPSKLDVKNVEWDELDDLLQVERKVDENEKMYRTLPSPLPSRSNTDHELSDAQTSTEMSKPTTTSDESPDTDVDYQSAEVAVSSTDGSSTLTNKSSDEYLTPMNTLRSVDFEDFKKQIREEYIQNTNKLQHVNDDTLKSRQPIDPSRINDSLKLYSDNMSKSFSGEAALRVINTTVHYQTLNNSKSETSNSSQSNYALKKSGTAATVTSTSNDDSFTSTENSINRSKSGPNWYRDINRNNGVDSDEDTGTLKPSTIKKRSINIKMDCYDEISNGVSSNSADSTTLTSPTSPQDGEYLYYNPPGDDDNEDDMNEGIVVLRKPKSGSTAIKRRSGNKR